MFNSLKAQALALVTLAAAVVTPVFAQVAGTNPIVAMLQSVDLTAVAAAIVVIGLIVVAIALTMKGPDVAKRVIRKV